MSAYRATLNLPKTDFPMRANLAKREPDMLARWEAMALYSRMRTRAAGRVRYVLHDGPPYANGTIHIGHALNKVLKDIIVKSRQMSGMDAHYLPGWDCHGLPIENQVEKTVGAPGSDISPSDFRQQCRDYAAAQITDQMADFKRLGILGDWDNPYKTMDYQSEADTVRLLAKLVASGHVYRGVRPVYWSVGAQSAMAEAEIEYHDKESSALDVRFFAQAPEALGALFGVADITQACVVIWTTTPWTLPANLAVAVHPALEYALVRCQLNDREEHMVLASDLVEPVMQRYGAQQITVLGRCLGQALEHSLLQHPFYDRAASVVLGDYVNLELGTGCVHTAPDHGPDDFATAKRYDLPLLDPVDERGIFRPHIEQVAGQHVQGVDARIRELLEAQGTLVHWEKLTHSYPHCWRTKTPAIFRATAQWFISMAHDELRAKALQAIAGVNWIPAWGETRISNMIAARPDWCISRQRYWGVPIPFFVQTETGQLHPDTLDIMERAAQCIEQKGIQAWFDLSAEELIGADHAHYQKSQDVLDVWFDSGTTWFHVLACREGQQEPADLYLEGSDQHRGWFHSSLLTSVAVQGCAPYRSVLTHGYAVDGAGRKMSKSKGNVVVLQSVTKNLGADIVRLWVASTDYSNDVSVSDEILRGVSDVYRRIRNTGRFLLANMQDFDPRTDLVPTDRLLAFDRWILHRAHELQASIAQAYSEYNFHHVCQQVHHFCTIDMGGLYLDVIKDRQYTLPADSLARRSAQSAAFHIMHALVRWIAPVLSFTADEMWQHLPQHSADDSVFLQTWYDALTEWDPSSPIDLACWQRLIQVRAEVLETIESLRATGAVGSSLDVEVTLHCAPDLYRDISQVADELRFFLIVSQVTLVCAPEDDARSAQGEGGLLSVDAVASEHEKCARCWHRCADIGLSAEHPTLCGRCIENVSGAGEMRYVF